MSPMMKFFTPHILIWKTNSKIILFLWGRLNKSLLIITCQLPFCLKLFRWYNDDVFCFKADLMEHGIGKLSNHESSQNHNSDRNLCTFHLKLSACPNPRIHINVWIVRYNIMVWVSNEHRDDDNIIEIVMKYHFSR